MENGLLKMVVGRDVKLGKKLPKDVYIKAQSSDVWPYFYSEDDW